MNSDRVQNRRIIGFAAEDFMPAGNSGRVEVGDHIDVTLDVLDHIPFHNPHVVAVEKHAQTLGAKTAADLGASVAVRKPVIGVIIPIRNFRFDFPVHR
ncbi:MAG: hypothetical protein ABSE93_12390 [Terriglobia bacterium]|jgi:hypothetical protein